jgi:hypothetical protein
MKSSLADLDMLTRRIANALKGFGPNESLTFHEGVVVPKVESKGSATWSQQRDRAMPQR